MSGARRSDALPLRRAIRPGPRSVASLVLLAWGLLLAAWLFANPPFAAPDEAAHYVRAIGISDGHLIGRADRAGPIGLTARQISWTRQTARLVDVPAGLDPQPFSCQTGAGVASAACLNRAHANPAALSLASAVGNYQPLPYLLPAVLMRAASTPPGALRLARAATAATALALLAVALLALFDAGFPSISILGLLLAVTPMTLFCGASLTGSGVEIAGAIAFFACLLRLGREVRPARRWWALTAVCGAILALSRPASPPWVLLSLLVALAWLRPHRALASALRSRSVWASGAVVLIAVSLNRLWEASHGAHVVLATSSLHAGLVAGAHEWWRALPELVGKFGYVDVKLPLFLALLWLAGLAGLCVAAMSHGARRLVLLVLLAGAAVAPIAFYALFTRPTGFGLQGRQLLPALVLVPLLAGEMVYRSATENAPGVRVVVLQWLVPMLVAIVQIGAWWVNARRFAVGSHGAFWFFAHPAWSPPAGWAPWLTAVALAFACLSIVALSARRSASSGPSVSRRLA